MKVIVFKDGSTREITGDTGKYWMIGEDRVRKLSREIAEIKEISEPSEKAPAKKKPAAKKKKAAEAKEDGERSE